MVKKNTNLRKNIGRKGIFPTKQAAQPLHGVVILARCVEKPFEEVVENQATNIFFTKETNAIHFISYNKL